MAANTTGSKILLAYGHEFPADTTPLTIELFAFREGLTEEKGGLGRAEHFWRIADMLWNRPDLQRPLMVRTPFAEDMIAEACEHDYLGVAGPASSNKSHVFAAWGIVNYLCDPLNTIVLLTSTTLREARKRVWGSVLALWHAVPGLPGKVRDSIGSINPLNADEKPIDRAGLSLIAAEKKKERDAVGKLIGIKNLRCILIADELPELSAAINQAAYSNLSNNPYFQMIALGNPNSRFDAFGEFCEPKDGWNSVSEADEEWDTVRGKVILFDIEQSPNYLEGHTVYDFMPSKEKIDLARETLGPKSLAYYRMFRGRWAPDGAESGIYSEVELVSVPHATNFDKDSEVTPLAALDPAFTQGGDRCIAYFGRLGYEDGVQVLLLDDWVSLVEDLTVGDKTRSEQIAEQFRDECKRRGVPAYNSALDASGAGGPFADTLSMLWSPDVLRVQFGGKASSRRVSDADPRPGHDAYVNRVSEIWYVGKEFIRTGQLRGFNADLAREMTSRSYDTVKGATGLRIRIETKAQLKQRIGRSPDLADAAFVLLELARSRFGFSAVSSGAVSTARSSFITTLKDLDCVDDSAFLSSEYV